MIPNVGTHLDCPCYGKSENQTISHITFSAGDTRSYHLNSHRIVYITEGAVRFWVWGLADNVTINAGEFIFLPIGSKVEHEATLSGGMIVFCLDKLIGNVPECHTFRFKRDSNPHSEHVPAGIHPLQANDRIRGFMEMVMATERDGLKCITYANLLISQLIFLIQVYYPQDVYTRFYSAIFSVDVEFSDFVYRNWKKYPTATELSSAFHMTPQQFAARFRKVFGEPPGSWIQEHKKRDIYLDICSSVKTLKEIAYEYNFPMSNLIRYCRMNFGQSPGAIRTMLQTGTNSQDAGQNTRVMRRVN
jgi:AraC-like DNA-binding protein